MAHVEGSIAEMFDADEEDAVLLELVEIRRALVSLARSVEKLAAGDDRWIAATRDTAKAARDDA